jgi:integrase/recombinase XerD
MKLGRNPHRGLGKGTKLPPKPLVFDDPHCLLAQIDRHLYWLSVRGFAESTLATRRKDLVDFCSWCEARGVVRPPDLNRLVLDLYQKWVARLTRKDGAPLCLHTQALKLSAIAGFCKWLARERLVLYNPAAEMELPKRSVRLPRTVLTAQEAEKVLAVPDVTTVLGLRDRAMLETLYSTGVRRSELARLTIPDIDFRRGVLVVRQGKSRKDRFVPVGERALAWIRKYIEESRVELATVTDDGALFLTADSLPFAFKHIGDIASRAIAKAEIGKTGSCHIFRHTMATLMLAGGADIRFIQQILGHASLETTQIYTRVSIHQLKAVHEATHPGAKLKRRAATDMPEDIDPDELVAALDAEEHDTADV